MNAPILVLVGGMLGAGKTSLILEGARRLQRRGRRVGVITNDQGQHVVDTALAHAAGMPVAEVAGGCFCCRLSDLLIAGETLAAHNVDVIFAEPVGSCLDIAATVVRPLLRDESARYQVAPLTVLVDPARARQVEEGTDANLAYLFRQQLAEADLVGFTKADRWAAPTIEGVAGRSLSVKTGGGVDDWLDHVLASGTPAGRAWLAVDYDHYARAEAALAWLNWHARVHRPDGQTPAGLVGELTDSLVGELTGAGLEIVHLKVLDRAETGYVRASVCASGDEPSVEGTLDASPAVQHDLIINARALGDPSRLSAAVAAALAPLGNDLEIEAREAFSPAPPRPERRA